MAIFSWKLSRKIISKKALKSQLRPFLETILRLFPPFVGQIKKFDFLFYFVFYFKSLHGWTYNEHFWKPE